MVRQPPSLRMIEVRNKALVKKTLKEISKGKQTTLDPWIVNKSTGLTPAEEAKKTQK